MDQNIFQQACLIQLSTPCWQGARKIDSSVMEKIGDSEWLRGRKYLVDPELLNPIRAVIGRARKDLEKSALPFPIKGLTLVPKDCLQGIENLLQGHQQDFLEKVHEFETQYEEARVGARRSLGSLFSENDYPIDIRRNFRFEWRYFTISTPGRSTTLTPEIYEREKTKFKEMMDETRDLAMAALREEFAAHIHHIVERLTNSEENKPKIFKDSMVGKIQDYIDSFDSRNLFQDEELSNLVEKAKRIIGRANPGRIRTNSDLREQIKKKMDKVKAEIDQAIEDMPRRKIRFAA